MCGPTVFDAGWSSLVARRAHNPKVGGSNPPPATKIPLQNRYLAPGPLRPFSLHFTLFTFLNPQVAAPLNN